MSMVVIILGVSVVVVGAGLLIMGVVGIIKKIRQAHRLNKAIKDLQGEDPLDTLLSKDNLLDNADRQHFQEAVVREDNADAQMGFFGKIKRLFSSEEKESKKIIKEIYNEKKRAVKQENYDENLGELETKVNQDYLLRAKSAYKILKSQTGRDKYQDTLAKKATLLPKEVISNEGNAETQNSSRNRRRGAYEFTTTTTRLQRLMMFFKKASNTQYQPSNAFKTQTNQARERSAI